MATQFTYPGVYIQEFTPGAPISGVGTSTPALIGPAQSGDLNVPTKITSLDQFMALYGDQPVPGFYLWYAVRGFFENGGQVCYVVRASNGTYGSSVLKDGANNNLMTIRARRLGALTPTVQVAVAQTHLLNSAPLFQPTGDFSVSAANEVTITGPAVPGAATVAAQFRPGDSVRVGTFGDHVIARISGTVFRFADDLNAPLAGTGTLRLSDALVGAKVFRIRPAVQLAPGVLAPGTLLQFTQGALTDTQIVAGLQTEYLATTPPSYRVTLRNGLNIGINQSNAATVQSQEFDLTVQQGPAVTNYAFLSVDPAHPRYYPDVVNSDPNGLVYAIPVEPVPASTGVKSLPAVQALANFTTPGTNEDLTALLPSHYTTALNTLQSVDDVNLVAIPDSIAHLPAGGTLSVQQAVIAHCEQMADHFAVLDSQPGLELFGAGSVTTQRAGLDSQRGYAALYYPWLRVDPVGPGAPILVPPSGHVCGLIARSDNQRGVHKAPANEIVNGAVGLERNMSDVDQGQLNIVGINVIRQFQGGRPTLWGARTTAADTNWRYVNIRRLFLFLEESIQEGIRWAVFEPNNTALWAKLKRSITEFLTRVWRDGALFGETPEKAFYVRIDETLNPDSTRALGQLFIQIGVRPSYPAEFIIVRIGIWQGGSSISEG